MRFHPAPDRYVEPTLRTLVLGHGAGMVFALFLPRGGATVIEARARRVTEEGTFWRVARGAPSLPRFATPHSAKHAFAHNVATTEHFFAQLPSRNLTTAHTTSQRHTVV